MEETLKEVFKKNGKKLVVEKDHILFSPYQKSSMDYVYYLEHGVIALLSYSKEGTEYTYQYFLDGRLVGYMPAVLNELNSFSKYKRTMEKDQFLVAKTKSVLYSISREKFVSLLRENLKVNHLVMQSLAINYMDLLNHTEHLKKDSAGIRLCHFLIDICEISGNKALPEDLTFVEIGRYLGVHAVSVSRLFSLLKKEGCIEKKGGQVVINDLDKIKSLVESEDDSIFK